MKTLRTVVTLTILFSLILTTGAVAGDITNLPWAGQVSTTTFLEKRGQVIELSFDYQAGNFTQRDHYQEFFEEVFVELNADNWNETGYHDHRRGEVDFTICLTYMEEGKILGTYFDAEGYGILMKNGAKFSVTKTLARLAKKSAEQVTFQKAAKKNQGFE